MAVAFNNTNAVQLVSSTTSFSGSFTVTSGPNLVAFALVGWDLVAGLAVTAITLGGNSMIAAGPPVTLNLTGGDVAYVQIYYLTNPPTGTPTLAYTISGGSPTDLYANVLTFTGAHQKYPIRYGNLVTASSATAGTGTLVIPSSTSDMTLSVIMPQSGLPTTNQTLAGNSNAGNNNFGTDYCTTPAASQTHTWTFTADGFVLAGLSIQPVASTYAVDDYGQMISFGTR